MTSNIQKPVFMTETSPIIMEHHQEGVDAYYEEDVATGAGGWGCFRFFCFGSSNSARGAGERTQFLQQSTAGSDHHHQQQSAADDQYPHKETWLVVRLKSLKEFSELVAGPKWKNFIRKFSKKLPRKYSTTTTQYDPRSYALNFNDGVDDDEDDDGFLLRNFSTRFAPPVPAAAGTTDQQRRPTNL